MIGTKTADGDTPVVQQVKLLVFSYCDGIGAIWVALASTEFDVTGLSFETDQLCVEVLKHRFPSLQHCGSIEGVSAQWLEDCIKAHNPSVVLLAGGTPCKQFSFLARNRSGLKGKDSKLFFAFLQSLKDLQTLQASATYSFKLFFLWRM